MKTIYLAIASTDHEGYNVIKGFETEANANDLIKKCEEYDSVEIEKPEHENYDTEEWDNYFKLHHERVDNHPASPFGFADRYVVLPIELMK